jgi:hypothetical protein
VILPLLFGLLIGQYAIPGHTGASSVAPVPVPTAKTCTAQQNSSDTVTCTFNTNPAAGETVLVYAVTYVSLADTLAVTDSASNTYTAVAAIHTPTYLANYQTQMFYFGPLTSSISTITMTASGITTPTALVLNADTSTGLARSGLDGSPCYAEGNSVATASCGSALTTSAANDLLFCGAQNGSGNTMTPEAGWTAGSSPNGYTLNQYYVEPSAGSVTPTISISPSAALTMTCAAFLP